MLALTDALFARHGHSEANLATQLLRQGDQEKAAQLLSGRHPDNVRLTSLGRAQAERLGDWLRTAARLRIDHYRTSSLPRAIETSGRLRLPNAAWLIEPLLVERSLGTITLPETGAHVPAWEAHARAQIEKPLTWEPPGGESILHVAKRVRFMLASLQHETGAMLCVTHRETLWAIRTLFEHLSKDAFEAAYRSRAPEHRIWNCELFHYSRRDPATGALSPTFDWMRRVRIHESAPAQETVWKHIARPRHSNDDLLAIAASHPSILEPDETP
ncbi:MAG: histidine phosphatase family protein [Patescibacteria group bacterium]|nr:MAG: histidine phosphatase family protein [Patescibacteria group bacterium]